MHRLVPVSAATILLAILAATNASAQSADCQTVQFSQSVLQRFPHIRDECRDIIRRDAQEFAVLESELTRTTRSSISVRFKRPDGSPGQSRTFDVKPDFRVRVDGKPMRVEELAIGQELTAYVKVTEPMLALAPAADDEPLALSPFTDEPAPPASNSELLQAASGAVLPRTAGALPTFGVTGLALTLIGCALTVRRRLCLQAHRE